MRFGIIDLGTNSVRFSFWEHPSPSQKTKSNKPVRLYRKKILILPGEDVFKTGRIPPKSLKRILKALVEFESLAKKYKAFYVVAYATCALREAKNSNSVLKTIHHRTQIPLKIIDGTREAQLIAEGILYKESRLKGTRIFIDIGGGSTEISLVKNRKVVKSVSLPLGSQRLAQLFPHLMQGHAGDRRKEKEAQLRSYIRSVLQKSLKRWPKGSAEIALGSSGTTRSLSQLLYHRQSATHRKYQFNSLVKLNQNLLALTEKQLLRLSGVEPKRRPLLVHGALLLEEVLNYFELKQVVYTDGSLRDGIVSEIFQGKLKPQTLSVLN